MTLEGLLGLEGWLSLLGLLVGWFRLLPHDVDGGKGVPGRWNGVGGVALSCVVLLNHDGNDALSRLVLLALLLLLWFLLWLILLLSLYVDGDGLALSWTLNMNRNSAGWLLLHSGWLLLLLRWRK